MAGLQLQCSPKSWRCPDLWRQQLPVREWAPAPAMQLCPFLKMIGRKAAQVKLRAQAGCRRAALCRAEQHAQHPQSMGLQQHHQLPGAHPLPMAPFAEASLPPLPPTLCQHPCLALQVPAMPAGISCICLCILGQLHLCGELPLHLGEDFGQPHGWPWGELAAQSH